MSRKHKTGLPEQPDKAAIKPALSAMPPADGDGIDPRIYLEQLIVDSTCELCCATTLPYLVYQSPYLVYQDKEPPRYEQRVKRVKRVWMGGIFKRAGYKLTHWKWWKLCEYCQLKLTGGNDLYVFSKFVFPVIRNIETTQSLADQLIPLQPMDAPHAALFYLDITTGPLIPPPTPERIEINFTVNQDGAILNDPGTPND